MPSPFPGMDPYLEGHLWPDVHNSLAFVIKELLVPQLPDDYLVQTEVYTVRDTSSENDLGILYPAEVMRRQAKEPSGTYHTEPSGHGSISPVTVTLMALQPIEVRIPVVKIRDRQENQLITAIEILSPVNKRTHGLTSYRAKREKLRQSQVHLLEIDLLRRGARSLQHPNLPPSDYLVSLARVQDDSIDVWAFRMEDTLPVVPVPLKQPSPDMVLDLGRALSLIYERSQYQRAIDYKQDPPPPALSEEEKRWMKGISDGQ